MYWDAVYYDREEPLAPGGRRVVPPGYYVLGYDLDTDEEYPVEVYAILASDLTGAETEETLAQKIAANLNKVRSPA